MVVELLTTPSFYAGIGIGFMLSALLAAIWGQSVDQLHCPTCGEKITNLNVFSEPSEFDVDQVVSSIKPYPTPSHWFIRCPRGHKWTVKTIFRADNEPDSVQLGEYLGGGEL